MPMISYPAVPIVETMVRITLCDHPRSQRTVSAARL